MFSYKVEDPLKTSYRQPEGQMRLRTQANDDCETLSGTFHHLKACHALQTDGLQGNGVSVHSSCRLCPPRPWRASLKKHSIKTASRRCARVPSEQSGATKPAAWDFRGFRRSGLWRARPLRVYRGLFLWPHTDGKLLMEMHRFKLWYCHTILSSSQSVLEHKRLFSPWSFAYRTTHGFARRETHYNKSTENSSGLSG